MAPSALVLFGDGINCERETAEAFAMAGFEPQLFHINTLINKPKYLTEGDVLALPGGFSFGDELGSGQVLASKIKADLSGELSKFVNERKPVIGICNGFQVLVKLGILPWQQETGIVALARNSSGEFQDRWVNLEVPESRSIWTRGVAATPERQLQLPIRHGEGRLVIRAGSDGYERLERDGLIALRYQNDVNGSTGRIAGLCDPSGVVLGLMPHPEAALWDWLHPSPHPGAARGVELFQNAYNYVIAKE